MKNKLIKRFCAMVAILAMLAFSAGYAFAVTNNASVISPYWQTDSDVYTFVAISHTSLTGMNSQIGVVLTAMTEDSTTTFGTSQFTIGENNTTRVFIVATNHSTINSTNITGDNTVFVTGTTNATNGSLVFASRATTPLGDRESGTVIGNQAVDATMLSYWGAIVVSSTNSGFAMEFVGDTHDSVFQTSSVGSALWQQLPVGLN